MSFTPRTKFPVVRNAELTKDYNPEEEVGIVGDEEWLRGELDFSGSYDPFEMYLSNPEDSAHIQLIKMKPTPEGVLGFVKRFGPLDDQGLKDAGHYRNFESYMNRLSHVGVEKGRLPDWPPKMPFRLRVKPFLKAQAHIRSIYEFWEAFRADKYEVLWERLEQFALDTWQGSKDHDNPELKKFMGRIKRVCRSEKPEDLRAESSACLLRYFESYWSSRDLKPLLVFEENLPKERLGFGLYFHVRYLIDAMHLMIYGDMCAGYSYSTCAKCGKQFVAKKRNQRCCSLSCTQALNSQKYYHRKNAKQTGKGTGA